MYKEMQAFDRQKEREKDFQPGWACVCRGPYKAVKKLVAVACSRNNKVVAKLGSKKAIEKFNVCIVNMCKEKRR